MIRAGHDEGTFRGTGDVELFYQSWRPAGDPAALVVLVPGFSDHCARYGNVVDRLLPTGCAVYAFDHRGNGRSSGQRGYIDTWQQYHDDLSAFVNLARNEFPEKPTFLYGHSMGGLVVLEYCLRADNSLAGIIVTSPPLGRIGVPRHLLILARLLSRVWPRLSMKSRLDVTGLSRDEGVVKTFRQDPLRHSLGTARLVVEVTRIAAWIHDNAAKLEVPLLMMHGMADRITGAGGSRRFFDKAGSADKQLRLYDDAYHELHNDIHHAEVLSEVEGWITRHS